MDKTEAIKILKDFHDESAIFSVRTALETLHPELKESEDEKIRKLLVEAVTQVLQDQYCSNRGVSKEKVVAWLEKQRQPRMQYGITINGVEYEMVEDQEDDECARCALKEQCHQLPDVLCTPIFGSDIVAYHRFEKI